jgi:hypothetical protein
MLQVTEAAPADQVFWFPKRIVASLSGSRPSVAGNPTDYSRQVRGAIKDLSQRLLITGLQPVDEAVSHAQSQTTFSRLLIGVLAVIAGVLAGVGLYGLLQPPSGNAHPKSGWRMALGAARQSIPTQRRPSAWFERNGLVVGLIAAVILTRLMTTMLVGVKPSHPLTFHL